MLIRSLAGLVLVLLLAPLETQAAGSMRCGSRLVSEGMLAAEVIAACGEPDLRDVWSPPGTYSPGYLPPQEQWTYNFGSSKLLRLLRFSNGRLDRIDSEGYGFAKPGGSGSCAYSDIRPGMSKYRLLSRCGEPLTKSADTLWQPLSAHGAHHPDLRALHNSVVRVYREEWIFNFGASQLLRIVTLENGSVVDVQTGRRGFDP
ncbi:DUF2845 domain-containing protein [Sinimarinibacterium sp. CAU 1509]|uniref:DUF2845 domain-containing protein n=1 Tax=Sinimarinibacterium sp. CAU 1509 TaxID=2562283 RepID=UPI0010AD38D3|nr:DUF2845 domain-containing protein [Sinimarinibacterium sp. CAU 1509]TJY63134.1 DUF2845 domain-containing protein [Sinimarinibacterium sp. CAU 1509]